MQPLTHPWMIAAATALVLFTTSCAATPAETPAPSSDTAPQTSSEPAEQNDATAQNDTAELETIELEGALVDSFPRDVPLYNALVVESNAGIAEVTQKPEWGVVMTATDDFDAVDTGIRGDYSTNGWTIGSDSQFGGGQLLVARGNGYIVTITYNDYGDDGISITYGVSAT